MEISKIRLNRGGYDSRGRYFGTGRPVFRIRAEVCGKDREVFVRAGSRGEAKTEGKSELVRFTKWPHCSGGSSYGRPPKKKRRTRRSRR